MTSASAKTISGLYNVREFGVRGGGVGSGEQAAINRALIQASADSGGVVYLPADLGTVLLAGTIQLRSNVHLLVDCTLQLVSGVDRAIFSGASLSNVKISGKGILNGNRAGEDGLNDLVPLGLAGVPLGVHLVSCTELWIDGLTFTGFYVDGLYLEACSRSHVSNVTSTDNGRHGISLARCTYVILSNCVTYDNSKVESAGTGDGVNLHDVSTDNVIIGLVSYDTAGASGRQGYGVREAASSSCTRNLIIGGSLRVNRTGNSSLVGAASVVFDGSGLTAVALASPTITGTVAGGAIYTSPVLTTPQINDTSADHQYVFAVNELAADRTITLPLLTGNDTFVFTAFAQTLTNKTLTSPVLTTPQINDTSSDHQYVFAVSELTADRNVTLPLLTGDDTFVFQAHTQTLTNKTLTSPVLNTPTFSAGAIGTADIADAAVTARKHALGAQTAQVTANQTTTSTSYVDFSTPVTVTLTTGVTQDNLVIIHGRLSGGAGIVVNLSFQIGAGAASDDDSIEAITTDGGSSHERTKLVTGAASGNVYELQFKTGSGTGASLNSRITVMGV